MARRPRIPVCLWYFTLACVFFLQNPGVVQNLTCVSVLVISGCFSSVSTNFKSSFFLVSISYRNVIPKSFIETHINITSYNTKNTIHVTLQTYIDKNIQCRRISCRMSCQYNIDKKMSQISLEAASTRTTYRPAAASLQFLPIPGNLPVFLL